MSFGLMAPTLHFDAVVPVFMRIAKDAHTHLFPILLAQSPLAPQRSHLI